MSSVTRFIRQVPLSTTYYNPSAGVLAGTDAYELVTSSSNYVGNYPGNGDYVQTASALTAAIAAADAATGTFILRDMGKTIYAQVGNASSGNFGWFRQVQGLNVSPITSSSGLLGGPNGSVFGVSNGTPDTNNTDYLTFYIPVVLAGVLGATPNGLSAPIAGGQM